MKDSVVLKRAMFSTALPKSVRNSGIMAGFEDDDMLEEPVEKEGDMPSMARTPQNPEILMNNLRGDMRSVDARYQELAQMVGEQAAQETPPEVLAMLQMQFGQQQEGIGALPQGAGMMPPPMGGGAPMGAPGGAPAMPASMPIGMPPQGAMPSGMESAGPFPQGGANQAPPTPDGMPPINAALGAFITPATRAAQFISDKAAVYGPALNQYLGNLTMRAQPTVQRVTGGSPPMPLSVQGRETLVQGPAGTIAQGVGTQFAPYTTMGPLMSPTFTEGVKMGVQRAAQEYPRVANILSRLSPGLGLGAGALAALPFMKDPSSPMTPEERAKYDLAVSQLNAIDKLPPSATATTTSPVSATTKAEQEKIDERQLTKSAEVDTDPLGVFIDKKLKLFDEREAKEKPLGRIERIKAAQAEYDPLYKQLLGDTAEDTKTNALLLLADAGFKLATTYKPTPAMAVAEAAKDLPRGFAALIAQAKDRDIKVKTAALTQAISDVQEQDKDSQALKLQLIKGDYDLLKKQATDGALIIEDAGLGGRTAKTKTGNYLGFSIDPSDPAVNSALRSRYTLRDTDNPFVMNRGEAPTTVETTKDERVKLGNALRKIDNNLSTISSMKSIVEKAYSPGTWFEDKVNNIFVPISFGTITPKFDTAAAVTQLKNDFSNVTKNSAAAAESGRISNQQQEWERENAGMLANPAGFFENPELAAKNLTSLEATNRNMRQQILTQLGWEKNEYVMVTPNTGTKNDPYVISSDPKEQNIMFNFLGSTFGRVQDPKAEVYLKMPNGRVDAFNPSQLRAQTGR